MNLHSSQKGFTLIELMIVIVIIAVLTSIAYPSYQDSVRKTKRSNAQADLLELAMFMERKYTETNTYNPASLALPFTASPQDGTAAYTLTRASDNSTFTLTATPVGAQVNDSCGTLTLTHTGVKTPTTGCW